MTEVYFPNACYICKVLSPLKRCSSCNMISYCGREHQLLHWPEHKDFCKTISDLLLQKNISHIFETCRGIDTKNWKKTKVKLHEIVKLTLNRPLDCFESQMICFPRACFVCHDSRQELLKNCPGCPNASFCQEHPSSSLHDKDCSDIKKCFELEVNYPRKNFPSNLEAEIISFLEKTPIIKSKSQKLPASIEEYFKYAKLPPKCEIMRFYLAEFLNLPLMAFEALQKLKFSSVSKLLIQVLGFHQHIHESKNWEVLFHLMPNLIQLNIIILEYKNSYKLHVKLCNNCKSRKKKLLVVTDSLHFDEYVESKEFEKPELLLLGNMYRTEKDEGYQRTWKLHLITGGMINCPVVIFTDSEEKVEIVTKSLRGTFNEVLIAYSGKTDFTCLKPTRLWSNEGICREHDQMIIFKVSQEDEPLKCNRCGIISRIVNSKSSKCAACESELLSKDVALFPKQNDNRSRNVFYINCCQVCHYHHTSSSNKILIPCKHCQMIFYCSRDHQKEHWPEHKDLCRIIVNMMEESGSSNIFEKADKSTDLNWFQAKINLLLKAQTKLGRNLRDYEREMFLFPKACFVCHDIKNLETTCDCGLSLCKAHKDSSEHKENCKIQNLSLVSTIQLLSMRQSPAPIAHAELLIASTRKETFNNMPPTINSSMALLPSMYVFIDYFASLDNQTIWELNNPSKLRNLRQILCAEMFTKPLSLFYALKETNWLSDSLVIHVIGATDDEKSEAAYWEIWLHFLPSLKNIKIVFVGPEVSELQPVKVELCDNCLTQERSLEVRGFGLRYDEYFGKEFFIAPDVVVGFNLHIHESDYGITEDTWNETILILKKVNVPFVITAKTFAKGMTDCKKIQALLKDPNVYADLKKNCFSGLTWMRDFETEKLEVANQFTALFYELGSSTPQNSEKYFCNCERTFDDLSLKVIPESTVENSE